MTEILEISKSIRPLPGRSVSLLSIASLKAVACLGEAAIVLASSVGGGILYHLSYYGTLYNIDGFVGVGLVAAVLHVLIAKSQHLFDVPVLAGFDRRWTKLVGGWCLVVLLLMLFIFLLKVGAGLSRGSMVTFGLVGGIALVSGRALLQRHLRHSIESGRLGGRRAVIIGTSDQLERFQSRQLLHKFGLSEVRRFVIGVEKNSDREVNEETLTKINSDIIASAVAAARGSQVDEIVLALRWHDEELIEAVCEKLQVSRLSVHLLPDRAAERFLALPKATVGGFATVEVQRAPLMPIEQQCKRCFDVVVATAALLFFLPLLAITAFAIRLETPGPVIFRQRRRGFDGHSFEILKFRTMNVCEDAGDVVQARRNDPRVTRVGRVLRQRSIDELPQLINVIRGDMSLVGPRPHIVAQDDKYTELIASYASRHHVKPGITGLAQVQGFRGETPETKDMQKRVDFDLAYVNGWSFWLDLRILFRTLSVPFRSDAY